MLQRSTRSGKRVLRTNSAAATNLPKQPRCVCQFSSTCKSYQHDPSPADPAPGQANVGAYDRLFAGLAMSSPQTSSNSTTPPRSSSSSANKASSYGPSFSRPAQNTPRRASRPPPKPNSNSGKQRLNPADLEAFRKSLDDFFPDKPAHQVGTEQAESDAVEGTTAPAFRWADLLDKVAVQHDRTSKRDQTVQRTTESSGQARLPDVAPRRVIDTPDLAQRDLMLERDVESEQLAQELEEEFKSLSTGVEAVQFMQERMFDPENGLAAKVSDPAHATDTRLLRAYPYLLTDLSRFLRSRAPHAALLPLKLASAYSPSSYFHGCTTALYTSTMKTRWQVWGDIEGCLALMQEMDRGAVTIDLRVVALVKEMQDAVFKDRRRAERQVEAAVELRASPPPRSPHPKVAGLPASSSSEGLAIVETVAQPLEALEKVVALRPKRVISASQDVPDERAYERAVETHTFFAPAERRALRTMERIIMENRERQQADRRREYDLEDAIRAQSKATSSSNDSSTSTSSVNSLIASYGTFERPKSAAIRIPLSESGREEDPRRPYRRGEPSRSHNRGTSSAPQQQQRERSSSPNNQNKDILSQAISELTTDKDPTNTKQKQNTKVKAKEKTKKLRWRGGAVKGKLGKTQGLAEVHGAQALAKV